MRTIDADKLKQALGKSTVTIIGYGKAVILDTAYDIIDNAQTEQPKYFPPCEDCNKKMEEIRQAYDKMKAMEKPQGEREFIEIFAEYVPDDICTYPEYRGKPYYSIHYTQNGEDFVGFGTYSPKVLSRYLRDYFLEQKGGAE